MTEIQNPGVANPPDSPQPVLVMDAGGAIVEWTPEAEAIFGWPREEAVGRQLSTVIIPERHRAGHEAGLKRFLSDGQGKLLDRAIEIVALHRDGHEFDIEVRIAAERSEGGYRFPATIRRLP